MFAKLLIRDIKMGFMHLLLLLVFHLIATHSFSSMQPLCRDDESSALLQFKESFIIAKFPFQGPSAYPKVASWNLQGESGDCCSWDGISCDEDTGHVIALDLSNSCLYGSINSTSTLFQLIYLQRLNLAYNYFNYSEIPSAFGHLSRLIYLNLSYSFFSGQIPSEISQLTSLFTLDLSDNDLVLRRPNLRSLVQNLTNIETLDLSLSFTKISSTEIDVLENSSSLTSLSLSGCGLEGEFPAGIFLLPKLQHLDVGWNADLTGYVPDFPRRIPLNSLILEFTRFSGKLPVSLGNLDSLNELSFSGCNFSGSIPSSLGNLRQLTVLDLSYNSFSGRIPSSLANLTQLTTLKLSANDLEGDISSWVGKLTKLVLLDLTEINLSEDIIPSSIANLTQLSYLDLSSTSITGKIPSSFSNLTLLLFLDLSYNNLQGTFSSTIYELKNLKSLYLSSSNLSDTVELDIFLNFKNLTELDLSLNKISFLSKISTNSTVQKFQILRLGSCNLSEFPDFLRNQSSLTDLDLSYNSIHGQIPNWMWNTSKYLSLLDLSHNLLTGSAQPHHQFSRLLVLNLNDNMIQGSLPVPPSSMWKYMFSNNNLTGKISPLLCNLSSLYVLDLSYNNLGGILPPCLGNLSNSLQILNLQRNNFQGMIPPVCTATNQIRMIDLSENLLQGKIPRSLGNCVLLEVLILGDNQITDVFPSWLGSLSQLRILILRSNRFYGTMGSPKTNFVFSKLHILDLSGNNLTGKLPSDYFQIWDAMKVTKEDHLTYLQVGRALATKPRRIENYTYTMTITNKGTVREYLKIVDFFVAIDLSNNGFEGEIPESIGNLKALRMLNLSNNILTGHIPSSLQNVAKLESLDLSKNKLTGEIPQQLTHLTSLAVFTVAHNHLEGPIPRGKQFDTFEKKSYEGNSGLCGNPLSRKCENFEASPAPPPSTFEEDEDSGSLFEFDWKIVLMGYGSGFLIGVLIGHTFVTKKWIVKTFGRRQPKRKWIKWGRRN